MAAISVVPRYVLGGPGHVPPSEKTTLAGIGVGGQGMQDMANLIQLPEVQAVAVCDVNRESGGYLSMNWALGKERRLGGREPARRAIDEYYAKEKRSGTYRGCKAYNDFRELLAKEKIDAVMVATPDHAHAVVTMAAINAGKHVYCEKPLAYSVYEARQMAESAKKAGVATQLGNQGQAFEEAPLGARVHPRRGDRSGARGTGVVRAEALELADLGRPPAGNPAGPRRTRLGLMARPGADAAVSSGVLPLDLAQLVGFRHRNAGRPGLPHAFRSLQGA